MVQILVILALIIITNTGSFAADVYMSTTGTKTSGKSTAGNWSNTNCYNNLQAAMSAMSSGDTLTINDGIYNSASDVIQSTSKPPDGPGTGTGDAKYTIVKARNIPCQNGVACDQPLKVVFGTPGSATATGIWQGSKVTSNYVKFEGLWFKQTQNIWGPTHWYFKQCAVQGDKDGNNPGLAVNETDYTVFEDFLINGKGRFSMVWFDNTYTGTNTHSVCRRCVARQDYVDAGNDPIGGFTIYHHYGVALLNSIVIDGDPNYWVTGSAIQAAFSEENNEGNQEFTIQGSIAINDGKSLVFSQHNGATGINLIDVAGIKLGGGVLYSGTSSNRVTMSNIKPSLFTYNTNGSTYLNLSTELCGVNACGWGYYSGGSPQQSINDSIITDTGTAVAQLNGANYTGNNLNYYNANLGTFAGTKITTNPFTNGLLYPVRIESGSSLATAGSGGGQVGANITQKLGVDGAEYGATDWNTPQGNLWPYPLEDWVKAQMAAADTTIGGDTMPSPTRGFATATGTQLDGVSPVTLTSYIWESLGNQIPAEIYGEELPADTAAPTTSTNKPSARYTSTQSVTLTCADNVACTATKFCYGVGCTPATTYSTPLIISVDTVLRYFSTDNDGNVEATKENVYTFGPGGAGMRSQFKCWAR